jgi:hypothetical protein
MPTHRPAQPTSAPSATIPRAMSEPTPPSPPRTEPKRAWTLNLWLAALVGLALVAFIVALVVLKAGGGEQTSVPAGGPNAVSESQLEALASKTDHPIYWAGPKSGAYELTRTSDGRIYIRYLPSADKVGDRAPKYLTIGTYPTKNAFRSIRRAAARKGGVSVKLDKGGLLVFNASTPRSVYFGYPNAQYQVEVYDPSPQQARALVLAGKIKPIE